MLAAVQRLGAARQRRLGVRQLAAALRQERRQAAALQSVASPRWLVPLLALALVAPSLSATLVTSSLTGMVRVGDTGEHGVTVTVTSPVLLQPRMATTGVTGRYWIGSLPPGRYDVTFSKKGLTSLTIPAVVELARVSRADGVLQRSEDEESVTSTVRNVSVADTTAVTTQFSRPELERLPLTLVPNAIARIAPGSATRLELNAVPFTGASLLGIPFAGASLLGEELSREVAVIRAGTPATEPGMLGGVIIARTRGPADQPAFSLRDTISSGAWTTGPASAGDGLLHLFEASAAIAPSSSLRLFGAAWYGDSADRGLDELLGSSVEVDWAPGASHSIEARYIDTQSDTERWPRGAMLLAGRYVAVVSRRTTVDVEASRSSRVELNPLLQPFGPALLTVGEDTASIRATTFSSGRLGDHVLSIGGESRLEWAEWFDPGSWRSALFVADRWSLGALTFDAGVRQKQRLVPSNTVWRTLPRLAVLWDVARNGRHAVSATHGLLEYGRLGSERGMRSSSLGYAVAFGSSGSARVDLIRQRDEGWTLDQVQAEGRYRLFERYEVGGTYTRSDGSVPAHRIARDDAHLWFGVELPAGDHVFGASLLQDLASGSTRSTGIALRMRRSAGRTRITGAVDATGLFRGGEALSDSRAVRVWLRLNV